VPGRAFVMGRVLIDRGIAESRADDSRWQNLRGVWQRFRSGEIAHAELKVTLPELSGSFEQRIRADEEGHLAQWLSLPDAPTDDAGLLTLAYELTEPARTPPVRADASVLMPPAEARFGVISDIDDTVLQTGATSLRSLARQVLFGNAHTRLPFEGVAAFYEALSADHKPLFYVSSSPWNLYDVLVEFMELNDIQLGPIMLRDWGVSASELLPTTHGAHKQEAIRQILETYPKLPFILIGDSGQEDPEIYAQVVHDFPGRILGIYIRDIDEAAERRASVQRLAYELRQSGSPLLLTRDTVRAAEHAAAQGWIAPEAVARVTERRDEDASQPV
jgi:phosphatidate phosphatase APP1